MPACRYCGLDNLQWGMAEYREQSRNTTGWRLFTSDGILHSCQQGIDAFNQRVAQEAPLRHYQTVAADYMRRAISLEEVAQRRPTIDDLRLASRPPIQADTSFETEQLRRYRIQLDNLVHPKHIVGPTPLELEERERIVSKARARRDKRYIKATGGQP